MTRPRPTSATAVQLARVLHAPTWWSALLDVLIPVRCAGCADDHGPICPDCARHLLGTRPAPVRDLRRGVPLVSAGDHDGVLRALLLAHKERGRAGLDAPLGAVLADAVALGIDLAAPGPGTGWVLVPVPSRAAAVRARGRNTVAALARSAAAWSSRLGVPMQAQELLRHGRAVHDQVGMGPVERRSNLSGAMVVDQRRLRRLPPGVRIIVVDDVTTTGASVDEAVRALRAADVRVVAAATLAQARRGTLERTNVEVWHPSGSVVALPEGRASAVRGKPMPAAGETAHVRRLLVDRSRCGLEVSPAPSVVPMITGPGEGQ